MPGDKRTRRKRQAEGIATEVLILDGDAGAVRGGLIALFARPLLARLTGDSRGTVEIVLAEVLNNIAEHAYAAFPGKIEISVSAHETFLFVRLVDSGLPMPGGELPGGTLSAATEIQDLPEGGFGWSLIRSLTRELTYRREGDHNRLSFCVDVEYVD